MKQLGCMGLIALIMSGCGADSFDGGLTVDDAFSHNLFTVTEKEVSISTRQTIVPVNIDVSKVNTSISLKFDVYSQPDNGQVVMVDRSNGIAALDTQGEVGDFSFEVIATDEHDNKGVGRIIISISHPPDRSLDAFRKFTLIGINASREYISDG
jgi:hypothetical protein